MIARRTSSRARATGVVIATTLATVIAAAGAGPTVGTVDALPPVSVLHVLGPLGATAVVRLRNSSPNPRRIQSIVPRAGCAPEISIVAALPADLDGNEELTLSAACSGTVMSGMKRCVYDANGPTGLLTSFEIVCEGARFGTLTSTVSTIDLGSVAVGSGSSATHMLINGGSTTITALSFQTTDLAGNFKIGAPCSPGGRECDTSVMPFGMNGSASFTVSCEPTMAGAHTAELHIAADTGQYLATSIQLLCSAGATTMPVLTLTGTPVNVGGVPVTSGSAIATLQLRNSGGGSLQITSATIVNGPDWAYTASGACTGQITSMMPCSLAGSGSGSGQTTDLNLVFDPSAIGPRNATMVIDYVDTAPRQTMIALTGTGTGGTLQLVPGVTMLDFGVVPVGITSTLSFQLSNTGNSTLTDVVAGVMPIGAPFTVTPASLQIMPGLPQTIIASCMPTTTGAFMTTVRASSASAFMSPPIALEATCAGTNQALYGNPSAIALGEVRTGTMPPAIPVRLLGTQPLTITSVALETASTQLALMGPTTGATPLELALTITPTENGSLANAILATASNGEMVRLPISGYVATADYLAPAARSLGTFCVGQPTTPSLVSLASTGTAAIGLTLPAMQGSAASPFDLKPVSPSVYPATLAAGAHATVEVSPKRQDVASVQQDRLIWMTDVATMPSAMTNVSAAFIDDGSAIAPTSLAFGQVAIHLDARNAQTITLQNCDTTPIRLDVPTLRAPFRLDAGQFPLDLDPNEVATIAVGFHPTRLGVYVETMSIPSLQLSTPLLVELEGEGINTGDGSGSNPDDPIRDPRSFYGCDGCGSGPASGVGGLVLGGLLAFGLGRRRRRRAR